MRSRLGPPADQNKPGKDDDGVDLSKAHGPSLAGSVIELNLSKTNLGPHLIQGLEIWSLMAHRMGLKYSLKGGLAAALYLHAARQSEEGVDPEDFSASREEILATPFRPRDWSFCRVPNDIDYTIIPGENSLKFHQRAFTIYFISTYKFKNINSPPYRGQKLDFDVKIAGDTLDFQGIAGVHLRCPGNAYYFDLSYSEKLHELSKPLRFNGVTDTGRVAPVEFIIFEKLLAARGPDMGKHDLSDALALLVTHSVNADLFTHLITRQRYLPDLDPESEQADPDQYKRGLCLNRLLDSLQQIKDLDQAHLGSTAIDLKLRALRLTLEAQI